LKKLLILEDDADTCDLLETILSDEGYETTTSKKALSINEIYKLNPHGIIMDYRLGDAIGGDLCREIKAHELTRHIPIMLLSAIFNLENAAKESCADTFLEKPFDIYHLIAAVNYLTKAAA
jgi:DNA-binding response OmpR family regulator